jgi:transcriptional regulator GlxA family with amidase domain
MARRRANQREIWANGAAAAMSPATLRQAGFCHRVPLEFSLLLLRLKRQFPPSASLFSDDCGKLGYRPAVPFRRLAQVVRVKPIEASVPATGLLTLHEGHGMKVAIVVFDGAQALDVAGPLDVFAEANTILTEQQKYEVSLVGLRAGTVTCSNGMGLTVPFGFADHDTQWDLLLIAGGPQLPDTELPGDFLRWLQNQTQGATRFGSVCTGAFVLARAGLLDGKEVTTHWSDANRLAHEFPQARVQPDKIFVRDGCLITSAGVTAGIDLCLSLVAEDWGHEVAVRVAKRLVVYIQREGGQSQYSPYMGTGRDEDPIIGKVHRYVTEHITDALSIEQLADAVGVSRRTFSRVFAKYAKVTPSAFVEQVRVDSARKLLEDSDAPLKTVAYQCGFSSATHMRTTFSRRLEVTPKQYRQRFRGDAGAQVALQ